jgi:hypothetical protein
VYSQKNVSQQNEKGKGANEMKEETTEKEKDKEGEKPAEKTFIRPNRPMSDVKVLLHGLKESAVKRKRQMEDKLDMAKCIKNWSSRK